MFKSGQVERQGFILYYAHSPNQWNHSGVLFHGHFHYIKMAPRIIIIYGEIIIGCSVLLGSTGRGKCVLHEDYR